MTGAKALKWFSIFLDFFCCAERWINLSANQKKSLKNQYSFDLKKIKIDVREYFRLLTYHNAYRVNV